MTTHSDLSSHPIERPDEVASGAPGTVASTLVGRDEPSVDEPVRVDGATFAVPAVQVIDVSPSVASVLGAMRAAQNELLREFRRAPQVAEVARVALVTFAGDARVALDFTAIADPATNIPELGVRDSGTNYRAAFEVTRTVIEDGVPRLRESASAVRRPTVFFLSDGYPNTGGDWEEALAALHDREWRYRPNVLSFGWDAADRDVIRRVTNVEGGAYFAADGQTPDAVFDQIMRVMLRSMISASQPNAAAVPAPSPDPDSGLIQLDDVA